MIRFEQTFADFLLHHQEQHNRTYHFLILMDALISAAKRIQHYYLTGALQGNLGQAGSVNVQGENVMRMDQIGFSAFTALNGPRRNKLIHCHLEIA